MGIARPIPSSRSYCQVRRTPKYLGTPERQRPGVPLRLRLLVRSFRCTQTLRLVLQRPGPATQGQIPIILTKTLTRFAMASTSTVTSTTTSTPSPALHHRESLLKAFAIGSELLGKTGREDANNTEDRPAHRVFFLVVSQPCCSRVAERGYQDCYVFMRILLFPTAGRLVFEYILQNLPDQGY
jgi:hypothetical protein